jgi:acetyl-CoA carboxylase, biotin carboxylase subunit
VDSHCYAGYTITPHYDSMIGKLIVYGKNRAEALARGRRALDEYRIGPIPSTVAICREILDHPQFIAGTTDTGFIERTW